MAQSRVQTGSEGAERISGEVVNKDSTDDQRRMQSLPPHQPAMCRSTVYRIPSANDAGSHRARSSWGGRLLACGWLKWPFERQASGTNAVVLEDESRQKRGAGREKGCTATSSRAGSDETENVERHRPMWNTGYSALGRKGDHVPDGFWRHVTVSDTYTNDRTRDPLGCPISSPLPLDSPRHARLRRYRVTLMQGTRDMQHMHAGRALSRNARGAWL